MSYRIDLTPNASYTETVSVSQDDVGREIAIDLYQDGAAYTIPSGTTITMQGTKPSGLGYTITGTNGTTSVTFLTTAAMTQEAGRFASELVLTNGSTVIGTANFVTFVEKNPHPAETIDGTLETIPALEQRIEALEDEVDTLDAGLESANSLISLAIKDEWQDYDVTFNSNYIINANRALVNGGGSQYHVSDIIEVSEGEKYRYSADMNWNNYLYVFYDSSGTAFGGVKSNNSGTYVQLVDEVIEIPVGAVGLRVAAYLASPHTYSLEKLTPVNVADKLSTALKEELNSEYEVAKKWVGKKWVVVGDSLTENNATASEKYHAIIAQKTGITVLNYGKSGTGYGKTYSTSENFCDRVLTLTDVECDVITIFGSFNDLPSIPIGTSADTGTDTLGGYINTTLDNLYSVKPFVNVGVILPTPWWGRTPDGTTEGRLLAVQYCELIEEIAQKRCIPVLDLFRNSNFHANDENWRNEFFYQADGTHPNNKGHAKIAPMIYNFLEQLVEL